MGLEPWDLKPGNLDRWYQTKIGEELGQFEKDCLEALDDVVTTLSLDLNPQGKLFDFREAVKVCDS